MRDFNLHTYSCSLADGTVHTYIVPKLWERVKDLPIEEVDLDLLVKANEDYIKKTWGPLDWIKVSECDLSYPIILEGPGYEVADGVHRLMKAHGLGHKTIQAKRIDELGTPDLVFKDWNEHFHYFKEK